MMDDLVKLVSQKTGLSQEMSKQAVSLVIDYLKKQMPPQLAAQVDLFLSGKGDDPTGALMKGLGGLFGGGEPKQ